MGQSKKPSQIQVVSLSGRKSNEKAPDSDSENLALLIAYECDVRAPHGQLARSCPASD
jgi:hypothetical protein